MDGARMSPSTLQRTCAIRAQIFSQELSGSPKTGRSCANSVFLKFNPVKNPDFRSGN